MSILPKIAALNWRWRIQFRQRRFQFGLVSFGSLLPAPVSEFHRSADCCAIWARFDHYQRRCSCQTGSGSPSSFQRSPGRFSQDRSGSSSGLSSSLWHKAFTCLGSSDPQLASASSRSIGGASPLARQGIASSLSARCVTWFGILVGFAMTTSSSIANEARAEPDCCSGRADRAVVPISASRAARH